MTLTFRDKVILLLIILALGVYFGYQALWIPASYKIVQLEENKQSIQKLSGDIAPLLKETERLRKAEKEAKDSVNNIKSLSGGLTATNEEFLVFLGDSAKENNVLVSGFNDLGTTATDGIYRTVFDFELKGSSVDINKVLEDINNMGIKCSFGSVSYRQNESYDYLMRFFDDLTQLPWYKEKDEEEEKSDEQQEHKEENKETEKPITDVGEQQSPQQPSPSITQPPAEPTQPPKGDIVPPANTTSPKPEDNRPEGIEDRLDDLLKQTSSTVSKPYEVVFLINKTNEQFKAGQNMKLNVTVCLIMYNEPSFENSFLNKTGSGLNEVL